MMAAPDALDVLETVPHAAPLQPAPESVQFTPLFCGSFCSKAVKFCDPVAGTVAVVGEMLTLSGAGSAVILIAAEADLVLSDTDVAVRLTFAGLGRVAGAV